MDILCISASNTKAMGENSASTIVCKMIKTTLEKDYNNINLVKIIQLS